MFGGSSSSDVNGYDFFSEENSAKWAGIFTTSLNSVLKQVHQSLSAQTDALEYVEQLIIQLLATLCVSEPHGVQDVEERVQKTFPDPIDKWAIRDAERAIEKVDNKNKKNSTLVLPVEKIHPLLVKEALGYRIDYTVTVYIVAVLEYIAADILKLTGNYVKNIKHSEITLQDIKVAICADQVLMDMFSQEETEVSLPLVDEPIRRESLTYEDIVKDFILEENQYLHDLNMIIKVFRAPFYQHFPRSKDLEVIFSNILDIYNFTANMLSSVEEQVEVAAENETPTVGICFQDIAEGEEFNVYEKYVDDMLAPQGKERLNTLLQRTDISQTLQKYGSGFKDAMKYVLPKLLLGPIYHCLHYFEVIKALISTSPNEEDRECLEQASGLLTTLKFILETKFFSGNFAKKKPWDTSLRLQGRTGRQAIVQKMSELQKSIDGWEGRDIWQSCSEFILDGVLNKHNKGRNTERHVFLFDALIVLCKPNLRRASVSGPQGEFKLKEKFNIRKITVRDKEDCDEYKNAFELQIGEHSNIILVAKTSEEKSNWMASLISLQTRSMLERQLDGILRDEEKQTPLRLPPSENYRFAIEDSENNIVSEESHASGESPLIKGGTLLKLVERLTYHMYADPKFVRTFLTTYRSFCSPQQLLDLLIERFEIPDLPVEPQEEITDNNDSLQVRDDLKRFRKEYVKPVQFRVVNVLRHWVDHHFYDFERDQSLLEKLKDFLDTIKGKAMKKMADSILKVIQRRTETPNAEREFTLQKTPPQIEWHLVRNKEQFDILTLHPIEIARQITLKEFDLYRAVQPSELVGSVWTKSETKFKTSPNLLKIIDFSNMITYWIEKCIIEMDNLEERVAVVCRCIEIMTVFQELNNFNGVLEVVSALNSAPVHRLEHTFNEVNKKGGLVKLLNDAKELNSDHFKKYIEKLRSINPPCVPFLGMYLTNILKTEEGNPDFLKGDKDGLINFSKRRKVAEITGEIQQYQNQPYCLTLEPDIREFLENLSPLEDGDEKSFNDHLYARSLEIEPRGCRQIPKFPRKTTYSLKSPGIRPTPRHNTSSKSHAFPFPGIMGGYQRIDEDSESSSPQCMTPPTPTTPISPCSTSGAENGVFANVVIGQGSTSTQSLSTTLTTSANVPTAELVSLEIEDPIPLQPPPLPPRRRNNRVSSSDVFIMSGSPDTPVSGSPEPPRVPPRIDQPPPVPPRRDSMYNTNSLNRNSSVSQSRTSQNVPVSVSRTLVSQTRAQSVSQQPVTGLVQNTQVYSATLPRYHGERDSFVNVQNVFSFNGENSEIPELPPRTYKTHSRNTSS